MPPPASAPSPTAMRRGRILALGGGGYNRRNIARAWTRVLQAFVEAA